jgi:cytochrome c oxidase assembly protein subunit 11
MAEAELESPERGKSGNLKVAGIMALMTLSMLGMAFAAVPLYYAFCSATGYGGTTRIATAPKGVIDRPMTTRFDITVPASLPLKVTPPKPVKSKIGEPNTVVFTATNTSNYELVTNASFNVTPDLSGQYFNKIECFCFTEQRLKPHETAQMPVTFFVDPDLDKNSDLDTITEITLSYTFYASSNEGS